MYKQSHPRAGKNWYTIDMGVTTLEGWHEPADDRGPSAITRLLSTRRRRVAAGSATALLMAATGFGAWFSLKGASGESAVGTKNPVPAGAPALPGPVQGGNGAGGSASPGSRHSSAPSTSTPAQVHRTDVPYQPHYQATCDRVDGTIVGNLLTLTLGSFTTHGNTNGAHFFLVGDVLETDPNGGQATISSFHSEDMGPTLTKGETTSFALTADQIDKLVIGADRILARLVDIGSNDPGAYPSDSWGPLAKHPIGDAMIACAPPAVVYDGPNG